MLEPLNCFSFECFHYEIIAAQLCLFTFLFFVVIGCIIWIPRNESPASCQQIWTVRQFSEASYLSHNISLYYFLSLFLAHCAKFYCKNLLRRNFICDLWYYILCSFVVDVQLEQKTTNIEGGIQKMCSIFFVMWILHRKTAECKCFENK